MKQFTPFGITFNRNSVSIKLRFNSEPFFKTSMNRFGAYRTTETGHVIFESELSVDDWHQFEAERNEYKRLTATK